MKIEITLHQETITKSGKKIPPGTWFAEYNDLMDLHGYDKNSETGEIISSNGKIIELAIFDSDENDHGQFVIEGHSERNGKSCTIKLFTNRT